MESLKSRLQDKKFEIKPTKTYKFQELALSICQEFGIENVLEVVEDKNGNQKVYKKNYQSRIFKLALENPQFLMGKVEYCRDRFNGDVHGKGKYLFSLFRKTKPWTKKNS